MHNRELPIISTQAFRKSLSKKSNTHYTFLVCCLIMIIVSLYSFASPSANEEELYQQCKRAYIEGKFADASQYIDKYLSLYPGSSYTGEILFMQAFLQPAIDTSIEKYRSIIEKYPNSKWAAKSHFQLGQCYYLQGKYDAALDHYGKIIVSYPEDETYWQARYWKCKSLIAKGDYEEAITALRSLENKTSEIGKDMILMSLGNCYLGMRDYGHAVASYRSLIESTPDSQWIPSAYLLLAKSLQNLGKPEEARILYQKVVESYHQSIEAQQYLNALISAPPKRLEAQHTVSQAAPKDAVEPAYKSKAVSYFTIQVGAFSEKRTAENLANKLRKKGYSVSVIPPSSGKKALYRVRIGTFKTRDAASEAAKKISKNEKLPTDIIYQSTNTD